MSQRVFIVTEMHQEIYQPGDGTRYRFNWGEVPKSSPDYPDAPSQQMLTVTTAFSHSMLIRLREEGFYLHPSYVMEKMPFASSVTRKMTAHFMNMRFSNTYERVLRQLLSDEEQWEGCGTLAERAEAMLPPVFATREAILGEIEILEARQIRKEQEADEAREYRQELHDYSVSPEEEENDE